MHSIVIDEVLTANRVLDIIAVFLLAFGFVPALLKPEATKTQRVVTVFICLLFVLALLSNCASSPPSPSPEPDPVPRSEVASDPKSELRRKFDTLKLAGPVRDSKDRCRMMVDIACTWLALCTDSKTESEPYREKYEACMVVNFPGCDLVEGITETEAEMCSISMLEAGCYMSFPPWQCRGIAEKSGVGPLPREL